MSCSAVARKGGGNFKLVGFNQATGLVSPLRRQICLNPVWRVGSEGSRSEPERPEAERSEAKLDSDKFGDEAAGPNWWLDFES